MVMDILDALSQEDLPMSESRLSPEQVRQTYGGPDISAIESYNTASDQVYSLIATPGSAILVSDNNYTEVNWNDTDTDYNEMLDKAVRATGGFGATAIQRRHIEMRPDHKKVVYVGPSEAMSELGAIEKREPEKAEIFEELVDFQSQVVNEFLS